MPHDHLDAFVPTRDTRRASHRRRALIDAERRTAMPKYPATPEDVESERAALLAEMDEMPEGALTDDQTTRLRAIAAIDAEARRLLDPFAAATGEALASMVGLVDEPLPPGLRLRFVEHSDAIDVIAGDRVIGQLSRSALVARAEAIERERGS